MVRHAGQPQEITLEVQGNSPMVLVVTVYIPQRVEQTVCPVIVVTLNDTVGDSGLIYISHLLNKVWRQGDSPVTSAKIQAVSIVLFCYPLNFDFFFLFYCPTVTRWLP